MTDFATKIAAFAVATKNQLFDAEYNSGEWMIEAVETQETLADFDAAADKWAECSGTQRGEIAGLPYICWSKVQIARGHQRRSMWVIDFGDRRVAIDADARFYA